MKTSRTIIKAATALLFLGVVFTCDGQNTRTNVAELSIEDLVNLQITSVSKKQTSLA